MDKKIIILVVIILVIFICAPWMTKDWCKNRLVNREFDRLGPVNESWEVNISWIPFGRQIKALKPESERPEPPTIGGYGFDVFIIFTGNTFGFIGR